MSSTDSMPFMDLTAAVSIHETRPLYGTGPGSDPHWHPTPHLLASFSEADCLLGINATQATMAGVASLAGVRMGQQTPQQKGFPGGRMPERLPPPGEPREVRLSGVIPPTTARRHAFRTVPPGGSPVP